MPEYREELANMFPRSHWAAFDSAFGHNFFDVHYDRTMQYDQEFIRSWNGKTVLEVGGFPGLETAALLFRGCKVTVIDSPLYSSSTYMEFLAEHDVEQIVHDIVTGAPKIDRKWDICLISDVFMHIDGHPYDFMDWVYKHAETVVLISYLSTDASRHPAKAHNLHQGYGSLGGDKIIVDAIENHGMELVKHATTFAGRELIVLKQKGTK